MFVIVLFVRRTSCGGEGVRGYGDVRRCFAYFRAEILEKEYANFSFLCTAVQEVLTIPIYHYGT